MPYGMSVSFKQKETNKDDRNKNLKLFEIRKLVIALAGPLVNLIILLVTYSFDINIVLSKEIIIYSNLLILVFNLLPIYPLDGGRILKSIFNLIIRKRRTIYK